MPRRRRKSSATSSAKRFTPPKAKNTGRACKECKRLKRLCSAHDPNSPRNGTKRKRGPKPLHTKETYAEALEHAKGAIATAAHNLGVDRTTVTAAMKRWPELKELVHSHRARMIDKAESKLQDAVEEGEGWAIRFTLGTLGKVRGYVERTEHTGPGGEPIQIAAQTIPLEKLSLATKRQILKELEEAGEIIEGELVEPRQLVEAGASN